MKFSVITVVKNEEKYIKRLIESVISQNVDYELLILDEFSTDRTKEIVLSFNDKNIKFIELNEHFHKRLAEGMNMATGEIIGGLSGDDIYLSNALSKINIDDGWLVGRVVTANGTVSKIDKPENLMGQGIFYTKKFLRENNLNLEWKTYPNICDYVMRTKAWKIQKPEFMDEVVAFAELSRITLFNKKERYLELKKFRQEFGCLKC